MKSMHCAIVAASLAFGLGATAADAESRYFGLLRARDLTPFGFLRLDMRPTHAISASAGTWGIEAELAYQNTWALSPEVERYLSSLPGRRELGPPELQAIRDLPGENYLLDFELAELDLVFHYKLSSHWGTYLVVSAVGYGGGFLDSAIEDFHDTFGFSSFGRPAVARNDVTLIFDLDSAQVAAFDTPVDSGLLDPTVGMRYSGSKIVGNWSLVVEAAVKIPVSGERELLSTGSTDYGLQATLQRFHDNHALYVSLSGVYYDGTNSITPTPARVIPTLVVGYERRLTQDTHLILQGYISDSVYSRDETRLDELLATKYQLSLGVYHRMGRGLFKFAFTENLQNLNNTPDIGFQIGFAFTPALKSSETSAASP